MYENEWINEQRWKNIQNKIELLKENFQIFLKFLRSNSLWPALRHYPRPKLKYSPRNLSEAQTYMEEKHNYDGQKQRGPYKRKSNKRLGADYRLALIKSKGKGRKEIRVAKPRFHEGWTHLGRIPASSSYFPLSSSSSSRCLHLQFFPPFFA